MVLISSVLKASSQSLTICMCECGINRQLDSSPDSSDVTRIAVQ